MRVKGSWNNGHFPSLGAIFMSNSSTMEECFERQLFGLPYTFADFVQQVKVGMVLFLFEYEKRKLYGVFRATSDGKMNIVHHAYRSTGKQFPAQVQFTTIWRCHPVSEDEFRDAIKENYFASHKFNFGLSKNQIQKLLWLFSSRKLEAMKSLNLTPVKKWLDVRTAEDKEIEDESYESKSKLSAGKSDSSCKQLEDNPHQHTNSNNHVAFDSSSSLERNHAVSGHDLTQQTVSAMEPDNIEALGDFIPLDSPEHSDDTENDINGNFDSGQLRFLSCDGYTESQSSGSLLPVKLLTGKCVEKDNTFAGSSFDGCARHGTDESKSEEEKNQTQQVVDCEKDNESDHNENTRSSMYSDALAKKTSIFSRLKFSSKDNIREKNEGNKDDKLLQNMKEYTDALSKGSDVFSRLNFSSKDNIQEKHGGNKDDKLMVKKTSVFSRLNFKSKDDKQEKDGEAKDDELIRCKKRKLGNHMWKNMIKEDVSPFHKRKYDSKLAMLASDYSGKVEEAKSSECNSVHEIMKDLKQRHKKWSKHGYSR